MLKPLIPVVHYTANYGVYSNELCKNKDRPEMHCNGTCQLAKMLAAEEPQKKDTPLIPAYEGLQWYMGFVGKTPSLSAMKKQTTVPSFGFMAGTPYPFSSIPTPPPQQVA